MVSFFQLSRRALHTSSRIASEDTRKVTSDFLARLQNKSKDSMSAATLNTNNAARSMIDSVGMRDTQDKGRKHFSPNKVTQPHNFTSQSLYPAEKPSPRPPLLGPPKKIAKQIDPFFIRDSNPLDHALNPLMSYAFINQMGKIKSRAETGLTWKSQRLVGKMVRRARHMGVIPKWANVPRPGGLGDRDFRGGRS